MSTSVKIHHTSMEYINSGIEMKNYETDNDESNAKSKEKADEFLISDDDEEICNYKFLILLLYKRCCHY